MAKKFYWLKIQENFFTQKEVKALRKFKKGATYVLIYQKMLVYSLKNDNKLYFDNVMKSFEEEVALMIDEEVDDVKFTIDFLKRVNLIDFEEDEVEMLQVEELTGEESESANRVRKFREKKKLVCNVTEISCNVDEISCNSSEISCNKNVTLEKELEKESEIELEKNSKIPAADDFYKNKTSEIEQDYEEAELASAEDLEKLRIIDERLYAS